MDTHMDNPRKRPASDICDEEAGTGSIAQAHQVTYFHASGFKSLNVEKNSRVVKVDGVVTVRAFIAAARTHPGEPLIVFKNFTEFKSLDAMSSDDKIDAAATEYDQLIAVGSNMVVQLGSTLEMLGTFANIRIYSLPKLVSMVEKGMAKQNKRGVLIVEPHRKGKTCALQMIVNNLPARRYYGVTLEAGKPLRTQLNRISINLVDGTHPFSHTKQSYCVMLDDAHHIAQDPDWPKLIPLLPQNVSLIVCATQSNKYVRLLLQALTPDLTRLGSEAFALSQETSIDFLKSVTQLPTSAELLAQECGQSMCLLALTASYCARLKPEEEVIRAYLSSHDCAEAIARCKHSTPMPKMEPSQRALLTKILKPERNQTRHKRCDSESDAARGLVAAGILLETGKGPFRFSSPLMKKIADCTLFPDRALTTPASLRDLVIAAVKSLPPNVLDRSKVGGQFPNEADFQQLFRTQLLRNTHKSCSVCPESAAAYSSDPGQPATTAGRLDFYLNGDRQYGIELLVKGNRLDEHIRRFEANGKYASLNYAVIDFLFTKNGTLRRQARREDKLCRVVFEDGDFTHCHLYYGHEKPIYIEFGATK